jgi:hypothetical protein
LIGGEEVRTEWPNIALDLRFWKRRETIAGFDNSFRAGHNSSPKLLLRGQLRSLVRAAGNLMQQQDFRHKVSLTHFPSQIFGGRPGRLKRVSVGGDASMQSKFSFL